MAKDNFKKTGSGFDPNKDKIAITIPKFTLLKSSDNAFDRYNEPYIVSLAVDANGGGPSNIDFSALPFPKVARGGTVEMFGDGHLVYGPKNPGEFVAISILVMESDKEIRELGQAIEGIVQSKAVALGMNAVIAANPGAFGILGILKELTQLVSGMLQKNGDDELFRTEGSFLRGHSRPYHINEGYTRENDSVRLNLKVIPLQVSDGFGPTPKAISI